MEGALGDEDTFRPEAGIIPRACNTIFDRLEASGHEFSVRISLLELYNEQMCDLLAPPVDESKPDIEKKALRLFEDATGKRGVMVSGLEEILCTSARDVFRLLVQASARRRTSSTQMNDKSSRSHCIFTMTIHTKESSPAGEDIIKMGRLNLVDLAGSENIARSGAKNKQATEAGHINQSLLTLGRVITALVEKVNHIPYRDSKLTRLLQESLGGRAKTVIIATVSPHALSYEETLSTLDYAHRAKNIKNRPECNQKLTQRAYVKDLSGQISMLKKENEALRLKNGIYLHQDQWDSMQSEIAAGKSRAADLEATLAAKEQELVSVAEMCKYKTKQLEVSEAQKAKVQQELAVTQTELTTTVSNLEQRTAELAVETFVVGKATQNAAAAASQGSTLKSTLVSTVADVKALHAKIDRKAGVLESNRSAATDMSKSVSERLAMLQASSETFQSTSVQATQEAQLTLSQFMSSKAAEFEALSSAVGQLVASIAGNANQAMSNAKAFSSDSASALNTMAATNAEMASVASNQIAAVGQAHIERIVALQTALLAQGTALQTTANETSARIQSIVDSQAAFATQHLNAMSQLTDAVNKASSEQDAAFESRLQSIEKRRAEQKAAAAQRAADLAMAVQQLLKAHEEAVESEFVEISAAELEFVSTTRNATSQHHEQVLQSIDQSTEEFNLWNSTSSEQHAGLTASIATDSELAVSQLNSMHTSAEAVHEDVIKPFVAAGTLAWTDATSSTQTAVDGIVQQCTAAAEAAVQSNSESIEISNAFNAQQAEISSRFDSICQSFVATADAAYGNEIQSLQSHTQSLCDELQSCGDVVSRTINQWKADMPTGATPAKDREYPLPTQMVRARTAAELRAMYGVEEESVDEVQEAPVAPIVLPIEDAVEVDKENDSLSFAALAPPTPVNVTPTAEMTIAAAEKPIVVEKAAVEKAADKPALVKKTSSIPTKTTGRSLRAPKAALSDTTSSALNSAR
jgi:kinesin family protein 11